MLTYARSTTIAAVEGLTLVELDHLHDPQSNSIGALLAHIVVVERSYARHSDGVQPHSGAPSTRADYNRSHKCLSKIYRRRHIAAVNWSAVRGA